MTSLLIKGGEWITAYQAEQRKHLKAVITATRGEGSKGSKVVRPPTNTREASYVPPIVLNASFLLEHCCIESPGDLSDANISGKQLKDVSGKSYAVAHFSTTQTCF